MMVSGHASSSMAKYLHVHMKFLIEGSLSSLVQLVTVFSETHICLANSFCDIPWWASLILSHFPNVDGFILYSLEW